MAKVELLLGPNGEKLVRTGVHSHPGYHQYFLVGTMVHQAITELQNTYEILRPATPAEIAESEKGGQP